MRAGCCALLVSVEFHFVRPNTVCGLILPLTFAFCFWCCPAHVHVMLFLKL